MKSKNLSFEEIMEKSQDEFKGCLLVFFIDEQNGKSIEIIEPEDPEFSKKKSTYVKEGRFTIQL